MQWTGYALFIVCTLLAFLSGCVGGVLLRLRCHAELEAIPMSFTASQFPGAHSDWVHGALVSYTKAHGVSAGAAGGAGSPGGSQITSTARVYHIDDADDGHAWQGAGVVVSE